MENFKSALNAFLKDELERDDLIQQLEQVLQKTPARSIYILSYIANLYEANKLSLADYFILKSQVEQFDERMLPPGQSSSHSISNADNDEPSSDSSTNQAIDLPYFKDDDMVIEQGLVIQDHYRLEEEIGKDSMGVVWKATDLIQAQGESDNHFLSIKFLQLDFKQEPAALKALVNEFNNYKRLIHPNIVKAHKLNRFGNTFFMVMEYFEGKPLNEFIEEHPNGLSLVEAEPIIKGISQALAYAHQEGITHSDFQPANVLYDPEQNIAKIIDFGITRSLKSSGADETIDLRSQRNDIFALAGISYELLSGKLPFEKGYELPPPQIEGLNHQQNKALLHGLALNQNDRTRTADQFLAELSLKKEKKKKSKSFLGCGGFIFLLLIAIAAGAGLLLSKFKPQQIAEHATQKIEKIEKILSSFVTSEQAVIEKTVQLPKDTLVAPHLAEEPLTSVKAQPIVDVEPAKEALAASAPQDKPATVVLAASAPQKPIQIAKASFATEEKLIAVQKGSAKKEQIDKLLRECQKHFKAQNLTTNNSKDGPNHTALFCYREVLKLDPNNVKALSGLKTIEDRYAGWAESALRSKKFNLVKQYLSRLEKVNPQSLSLIDLRQRLKDSIVTDEARKIEEVRRREEVIKKEQEVVRLAEQEARQQEAAKQEPVKKEEEAEKTLTEAERQNEDLKKLEAAVLLMKQSRQRERKVAKLLLSCNKHFRGQRYTTGRSGNALSCYQEVLKLDPTNIDALEGLKSIERHYQAWAEKALQRRQLHKVPNILKKIEMVNPDSVILADLKRRLKDERAQLREQDLIEAERKNKQEQLRQIKRKIAQLLPSCKIHFSGQRYTSGKGGNALSCYREVLELDPTNVDALEGLKSIEQRYQAWAEGALQRRQLHKAAKILKKIEMVNPDSVILADLKRRLKGEPAQLTEPDLIEAERKRKNKQKQSRQIKRKIARLLPSCKRHFRLQRYTSGRGGNALSCYRDVLELDPTNVDALKGIKSIEQRYQAWAERALRRRQLHKVAKILKKIEMVNPDSAILADLKQRLEIKRKK